MTNYELDALFRAVMDINSGKPNVSVAEATRKANAWRSEIISARCPCGVNRTKPRSELPSRCECRRHIVFNDNDAYYF